MNDDAEINAVFCALVTQRPNSRPEHLMAEAHEIVTKGRRTRERIARIAAARRRYEEWAAGKPEPMAFLEALPQIVTGLQEFRPTLAKKNLKTLLHYISPFYRSEDRRPENPETLIEHWQKNGMPLWDVYFLKNCYQKYWPEVISEQNRANAQKRKREKKGPPEKQRGVKETAQFVTQASDKLGASKRDLQRALKDKNKELEDLFKLAREGRPPESN